MKKRATFAFLLLVLVLLAVARWTFDGARWIVAPRRRPEGVSRAPRPATAK